MTIENLEDLEKVMSLMSRYRIDRVKIGELEVYLSFHLLPDEPKQKFSKDELIAWSAE